MKLILTLAIASLSLFTSCSGDSNAAQKNLTDATKNTMDAAKDAGKTAMDAGKDLMAKIPGVDKLGSLLDGIKDGPTAEKAKGQLETIVTGLKGLGSDGVKSVMDKIGGGSAILTKITSLMSIEGVKNAIGPVLESLKNLIPAK